MFQELVVHQTLMSRTKVLHITYDMRIGGTEMVIKNLIEGSDPEIFDMSIFCIEKPIGPWGIELQNKGIKITAQARQPGFDIPLIFAIRKHIKTQDIDVLHCHQYTPWVFGVLAAFGTKTQVIFTEHGRFYPDFSSWKRKLINPWLCKITNQITAISKATKQALVEYENIPDNRIDVIYNGISPLVVNSAEVDNIKKELDIGKDKFVFGTVARLDPIKNHQMMLKAFKLVKKQNSDAILVIVGDGEEKQHIMASIESLNLQDDVLLTGYKTNPAAYLAMFDVFLLSSLSEGTSMTLLESMSLSKPCVVTDAGGNKEIIINNENGFVSENDDAQAFADSMSKFITNQTLREEMSERSLVRYQQLFSDNIMNKLFSNLYLGQENAER
jgi:glycosyltransferase involved in cell wall biosynthesis